MDWLNRRYDTDEKRGWFVWSIFFGVIFGVIGALAPTFKDGLTLALSGILILIGLRWFIGAILDSMYGVTQND